MNNGCMKKQRNKNRETKDKKDFLANLNVIKLSNAKNGKIVE